MSNFAFWIFFTIFCTRPPRFAGTSSVLMATSIRSFSSSLRVVNGTSRICFGADISFTSSNLDGMTIAKLQEYQAFDWPSQYTLCLVRVVNEADWVSFGADMCVTDGNYVGIVIASWSNSFNRSDAFETETQSVLDQDKLWSSYSETNLSTGKGSPNNPYKKTK